MKTNIITTNTYSHKITKRVYFGPSRVKPNQAYSLKEIVSRFQQGEMLPVQRVCFYDDEPDIDHPQNPIKMDLVDIEEQLLAGAEARDEIKRNSKQSRRSAPVVPNSVTPETAPASKEAKEEI